MSHRASAALLALALSGCFLTYDANDVDRPPATAAPGTLSLGEACLLDDECGSGACAPEGICCNRACSGECEACNGVGTGAAAGTCGVLSAGLQPHSPHGACITDGSACGGSCNGALATCAYSLGQCRNQTCTASSQENATSCDGAGHCPAASTTECAPYACGGIGCRTGCVLDTACSSGNWCDSGDCVPKTATGGSCTAGNECQTSVCSPDGTCCDRACTGQCEACNGVDTGAAAGTCGTITNGSQPQPGHTACAWDGSAGCQGSCNGTLASACAYPATECRPASCAAGTQSAATACSGGSCPAAVTQACTPFVCGAIACKTSCTMDVDCITGDYCSAPSCVAKKSPGASCGSGNECTTDHCVDGVCCNSPLASCGGCSACNVAGKAGTCWPVPAGSDPHDACTTANCQTTCDGAGACGVITLGLDVICASASCVNGAADAFGRPTLATASVARCAGAQVCPGLTSGSTCGTFTCSGSSCATPCANNGGCISNTLCAAGRCQYCSTAADCGPGAPICNGGYCECADSTCDSICSGAPDCSSGGWGDACVAYSYCSCTPGITKCNGRAPLCTSGSCTQCGSTPYTSCLVGQLCTTADALGECRVAPGFPCSSGSACASGICNAGFCTTLPAGGPCTHGEDCTSGTCNASWLCD